MEIGNQILFFLAGLGVFNGCLLAIYFLFMLKPKKWVNILFGLLMLMLCIRIGKSLFHVFTDLDRIYRQIGLSACIMIGPFLFLYIKNILSKTSIASKSDWAHILIPLLGVSIFGLFFPYEHYDALWNKYVVQIIYAIWIIYTIAACWLIMPLFSKVFKKEGTIIDYWLLLVGSSVSLICLAYNLSYYGIPYLSGPIIFSAVFYILTGFLISNKNYSIILQQEPIKYQNQKISESKANDLIQRLSKSMQVEKPYLNSNIKLADIAKSIDASPHEVSQVVNNKLKISFNHYINQFRVKDACVMLKESDHLTIEGIGQEVGFNSRSTFYKAFKTIMNQTPLQYKSQKEHV